MKRLLPWGMFIWLLGNGGCLQAQDVSVNITPQTFPLFNHTFGFLRVSICNNNPTPVSAPANKLRPLISFPDNLTVIEALNTDGTPVSNFSIFSLVNEPSDHTIVLLNTTTLPQFECFEFDIKVFAEEVGTGPITCTLGFQGPPPVGNNPANDNSVAVMPVEINLPVKLQEFKVTKEGAAAQLSWVTSEEVNSERFDVQKSSDGKNWKTFETVQALGESKDSYTYHAVDKAPFSGENLYRLHMIDKDGTSAYSSIRNINFEGTPMSLYPNPVSDELILDIPDLASVSSVQMFDLNGKEVYNSGASPKKTIKVRHLHAGAYVVRVKGVNGDETSSKILVVK